MDQTVVGDHLYPSPDMWIALYQRGKGFVDVVKLLLSFLTGPDMRVNSCSTCYSRQCDGFKTDTCCTIGKILCVDV